MAENLRNTKMLMVIKLPLSPLAWSLSSTSVVNINLTNGSPYFHTSIAICQFLESFHFLLKSLMSRAQYITSPDSPH